MYKVSVTCEEIVTVVLTPSDYGRVRLVGVGPTLLPARSIMVLEGSTRPTYGSPYSALVECVNVAELPNGLTVGASLVTVHRSGLVLYRWPTLVTKMHTLA